MPSAAAVSVDREKQSAQLRERAKRLLIQKRFQRAVDVCNEALHLTPGNYKVLRIRSTAWCQIADADVVLKAVPYSGDAWYQKGYSHFHLKDYTAAAHAFAEGLDKNGADRTLQHGFADALALMARIKATQVPTGNTATAPDPAPPVSLEEFEPAAPQELSPELPPPGEHDPPDNDSGDSASTGQNLAEDAADDAPACKDVTAVDEERENSGAAADHAPDEEQPKVALEGVAAAPVAEPSEGTAEEEEEAAVLEEAGEQQGDGEQAGDADDSGVGM